MSQQRQVFVYVNTEEKKMIREAAFKLGMSESAMAGSIIVPAVRKLLNLTDEQAGQYKERLEKARGG